MAAFAILDFENLKNLTAGTLGRANVHYRAKFHRNRSSGCREIAIFQFFKMAAVAILNFQKFKFLTAVGLRRLIMCYRDNFHVDWSNRGGDMAIYDGFLKWRPPHLGI